MEFIWFWVFANAIRMDLFDRCVNENIYISLALAVRKCENIFMDKNQTLHENM